MSGQMRISFPSWTTAATTFDDAANAAPRRLADVVTSTTDGGACGAAKGLATVDGAVAIMLSVFGEIMSGTVVPSLRDGLATEADGLVQTGKALRDMEDINTDVATSIGADL